MKRTGLPPVLDASLHLDKCRLLPELLLVGLANDGCQACAGAGAAAAKVQVNTLVMAVDVPNQQGRLTWLHHLAKGLHAGLVCAEVFDRCM